MEKTSSMKWVKVLAVLCIIAAIGFLASLKVTVEAHLWLSGSALLIALAAMTSGERKLLHLVMLITGAVISLRYLWWRFTETLPVESSMDMPFAIALLVTECYGITISLLGMFINVRKRNRDVVPIDTTRPVPTIDVFIPTYDESIKVVSPTISAAIQMDYPGTVNVWVLDDGGTQQKLNDNDPVKAQQAKQRADSLKVLCRELGANYLTRPANISAKAGNINHALEHSDGELILILDADHVPSRDFLLNTVGMFQQHPKLGFVQTPHFFVTPGPVERNLGLEDKMPSENEMFYNRILSGMDFWNASFFCGSAAVMRRTALLDVGGIATRTITEDADTALDMHAKGWDSAYFNRAMIAGLSPDTFGAYVTQRSRWAQGMVQIFLLNNPLFKRGLSWPQKFSYLNSTLFWFFPLFRMMYLLAPLCYLLFDLQIFVGNANDFLVYAIPHLLISMLVTQHLFGKTRHTLFSEFYETVLSIFLFIPVLSVLVSPKKPSFAVTPKGETTDHTHFSTLAPVMFVLFGLIATAEVWGIYRIINYPIEQGQLAVVLGFNTLNLLLCATSLGAVLEKIQRRSEPRIRCDVPALLTAGEEKLQAKVHDASVHGARITVSRNMPALKPDQAIKLTCFIDPNPGNSNSKPKLKPHTFTMKVRNSQPTTEGLSVSCTLLNTDSKALSTFTGIVFAHSERWLQRRNFEESQRKGILGSLMHFCRVATSSVTNALGAIHTLKTKKHHANQPQAAKDLSL